MSVFFYAYSSKFNFDHDITVIPNIVRTSRLNNLKDHITGMLIFDGEKFFQFIEGDQAAINSLVKKIKSDNRHIDFIEITFGELDQRVFNDWNMAYTNTDDLEFIPKLSKLCSKTLPSHLKMNLIYLET